MSDRETLRALVSAFNVHNYARNTVKTNFTLQSDGKKDYIVVSFDKSMDTYQCRRYLDSIKRKIIREFYGIEESNDAEILDTAKLIFDVNSFPFDISKGDWSWDKQHEFKFLTPVDKGVIFNLKSHLASSLAKDIREDMRVSSITVPFTKGEYLCCSKFPNKKSRKKFESEFLSRMKERGYENVPKNLLKGKGNSVYIKNVFDDASFIDSVTRYKAWLVGMYLGVESSANYKVKLFKDMIIESIGQVTRVTVAGFIRNFPLNGKTAKILIPVVLDNGEPRILASEEALKLSCAFNYAVFNNIYSKVQAELPICGDSGVYGIDFSSPYISHCVITKIIKNSVINKDHELAIDPELRFRALSRSPSTELSDMEWESPTRSPDGALKDSPRQWSEREEETGRLFRVLREGIGQASTSSQQTDDMPCRSYTSRCRRKPLMSQPSMLRELSLSEGAYESMPGPDYSSQQKPLPQSSCVITSLVRDGIPRRPILLTTKNDQKSSSREFSARSPCFEDVNILGMKSEEHDKSEQGACSQVGVRESSPLEGAQADDESMPIEIRDQQVRYSPSGPYRRRGGMTCRSSSILFPTAWDNSISLNLGVSEDSPKDTKNICNEEPEKQQVTDKSDQKSSDECSEAKSQESESPEKKHGGGLFCKKGMPILPKLSPFKRRSVERDTMCSSKSDLVYHVTEKSSVSEPFRSFPTRIKAESNPPSGVTSPTHEGGPEWQQLLNPDQREELRSFLSPEERKKLNSNSFSPGEEQHLNLTHTLSWKREPSRFQHDSEQSQLLRLTKAQLPDNSSFKRDSGYSSGLPASPAVPHKESVSSEFKKCSVQQVKHMSEALGE